MSSALPARPRATAESDDPSARSESVYAALVLAAVGFWVLWRTGPGTVPYLTRFEEIARAWPHSQVEDYEGYVLRAPLGQLLYRQLPHSVRVYLLVHLLALGVSFALLLLYLLRRHGIGRGTVAAVVVIASPVVAVLLLWVGLYDAYSFLVIVLLVTSLRSGFVVQLAAAFVAGFQDFEQVIVGVLLVLLLPELSRTVSWRPRPFALFGGLVIGKTALEAYLHAVGAPGGSRLSFLLDDPSMLRNTLVTTGQTAPLILMSALGGLWVFALPWLTAGWPGWSAQRRWRLVAFSAVWLGSGVLALDHSRVLALVSVPVIVGCAEVVAVRSGGLRPFLRRWEAWALLLFPPIVVWDKILLPLGVKLGVWHAGPF